MILETRRLRLRHATLADADFFLGLMNEPSWLRFVGDRGIHSAGDAAAYITDKLLASYAAHGFGLFVTELREETSPLGICGLIQREELDDVDIGFAFLPRYWGRGYAYEAAAAVLGFAQEVGLKRVVALTTPDNEPSIRLLEKLGLAQEGTVRLSTDGVSLKLFAIDLGPTIT